MKRAPWLLAGDGGMTPGRRVILDPAEGRHASGPLRLRVDDEVVLTDGAGAVATGRIRLLRRADVEVDLESVEHVPRPEPGLTLAVAVLAGPAMDLVVQKAVELGVEKLLPICCRRSQLGLKRAATRMDHWTRLGRQSLKQCRRAWAMEISDPISMSDLMAEAGDLRGLVGHPEGLDCREIPRGCGRLLLIGPEGGFAAEEETALEAAGWPRIRLGPHVLRAETAAVAGAAILGAGLHSPDV